MDGKKGLRFRISSILLNALRRESPRVFSPFEAKPGLTASNQFKVVPNEIGRMAQTCGLLHEFFTARK